VCTCWPREAAAVDKLVVERWLSGCQSMGRDLQAVRSAANQLEEPRTEFPGTPPRSCCWFRRWIYDVLLIKYGNNVTEGISLGFVHAIDHLCICKKCTGNVANDRNRLVIRSTCLHFVCETTPHEQKDPENSDSWTCLIRIPNNVPNDWHRLSAEIKGLNAMEEKEKLEQRKDGVI
jgi:hypothetical protein